MKSLHDYLIQEKLKINKNSKNKEGFRNVDFPVVDWFNAFDGGKEVDDDTKTYNLDVPTKKWIIFADSYRHNQYHFGSLGDLFLDISFHWTESDFEDYTPDKIIYYQSDDLYDALKWYINKLIENKLLTYDNHKNSYVKTKDGNTQVYDSEDFINDILNGNIDEKDLIIGLNPKYAFPHKKQFDDFKQYIQNLTNFVI